MVQKIFQTKGGEPAKKIDCRPGRFCRPWVGLIKIDIRPIGCGSALVSDCLPLPISSCWMACVCCFDSEIDGPVNLITPFLTSHKLYFFSYLMNAYTPIWDLHIRLTASSFLTCLLGIAPVGHKRFFLSVRAAHFSHFIILHRLRCFLYLCSSRFHHSSPLSILFSGDRPPLSVRAYESW